MKERQFMQRMTIVVLLAGCFRSTVGAVEPEKQPIYSNTIGGLLCGDNSGNQCTVPARNRLIIEYVSGYVFKPASANVTTVVSMAITDAQLGLHGNSFHSFLATKANSEGGTDVFVFSAPLRMMLHPQAQFYFQGAAGLAVSGYLVSSPGPVVVTRPPVGPVR